MMILNFKHKAGRSLKMGVMVLLLMIGFFTAQTKVFSAFSDLPNDPVYKPYLENFEAAHVIVGDTQGGKPTGTLRPNDFIQRDEFTKVAVLMRLLEQKQKEGLASEYQGLNLDSFTLKIAELLKPYYKVINGAKLFSDIEQKDEACASDPSGCQPWYTEYINYASSQGMIKGYADNTFRPGLPILRIHALKLIMAENGNIPANQDVKFKKLSSDPRIQKVSLPKCLKEVEPFILNPNGGNTPDSKNLLAYALLADKLDLFGSDCQLFAEFHATTPEQRANVLQQPLTRKEIARYYALTTDYSALMTDPATDPTTSTAEENGMTYFDPDSLGVDQKKEGEKVADVSAEKTSPKSEKPDQPSPNKKQMIQNPSASQMSIEALAAKSQTGRCCTSMDLGATCKLIHFEDYVISETPVYNYNTYQGATWYLAQRKGESCYIPFADILGRVATPELQKVEVTRGSSVLIQNEDQKSTVPDLEKIQANLNAYFVQNHSLEQTRDWGLKGKVKSSEVYNYVLEWYKKMLARRKTVFQNLDGYYKKGHTLDQTVSWGVSGKSKNSPDYKFVSEWFAAKIKGSPERQAEIVKNLDKHYSETNDLEGTRDWGLKGKDPKSADYLYVMEWYNEKRQIEDKKLLSDEARGPEFWEGEVWSPYDDWMTVSYQTGSPEREAGLVQFIKDNKQMFIDAANAPKVKGKVSPSLIAAIMWDEIVGNDKIAKKFGSEGYSKDDFKDETNDFFLFEGHTYGPFQISIATAVSVIEGGYVKAPIDYDTFFENIDPKYAYHDNEGRPVKRNNGLYLKDLGKEKLEAELTKFPFAVKVSAGRLAQTIDFWNVPPDNNGENGGSDLRYADEILGTLYSKGLVGSNGVNDDPTPNDRGLGIANKSKEFNELFFEGKYMQLKATPIN